MGLLAHIVRIIDKQAVDPSRSKNGMNNDRLPSQLPRPEGHGLRLRKKSGHDGHID